MIDGKYLLLGSNLGDRQENLKTAKKNIEKLAGPITRESSIYQTSAWGIEDQGDFLNQVVVVSTSLNPSELLETLLGIEKDMGRIRKQKWGSRLIDIDILFYDNQVVQLHNLKIPHPGIPDRRFTLVPLIEIDPDGVHPETGLQFQELLDNCEDKLQVEIYPSLK